VTIEAHKETLGFQTEVKHLLHLMIHSLYSNKEIFLRELISNASDACDKMRYLSSQNSEIISEELKISIEVNKSKKILIISDNGIGMNKDDLVNNLGTIAKSGTENFIKSLSGDNQKDVQLIGQFGVGFYSSFMIAKSVDVISKKYDDTNTWHWKSEGLSQFTINESDEKILNHGTKIILHLKNEANEFLDRFHIKHIVQTYSDHINFPIEFIPENLDAGVKIETLNSASALWKKSKDQITAEQYNAFLLPFILYVIVPELAPGVGSPPLSILINTLLFTFELESPNV
jgi:molecular chaperone HtpG